MQRCSIDEHMTYDVFVPPGCAGGQSKVDPALATSSLLGLDPFVDPSTRRYGHFAYRFQAEPPFMFVGRKAIIRPECLLSSVT